MAKRLLSIGQTDFDIIGYFENPQNVRRSVALCKSSLKENLELFAKFQVKTWLSTLGIFGHVLEDCYEFGGLQFISE